MPHGPETSGHAHSDEPVHCSADGCLQCPAGFKSPGGSAVLCVSVNECAPGFVPSVAGAANDDEACAPVAVGSYAPGGAGSVALPMVAAPPLNSTTGIACVSIDMH